jgi:FADH2 O2-dependent halogenase
VSKTHFDFIVFGAGFSGSIMSMVLRQLGYSVALLEKGKHPRFVIGESSTPFANLLLEQISEKYSLPALRPLCEWGSWQKAYPQLPVGLKRGFTFYHHSAGTKTDWRDRDQHLLVAASPNDHVADTHWYRPSFDLFLLEEAQRLGVEYLDEFTTSTVSTNIQPKIEGTRHEKTHIFTADFLIDATGANSLLANHLRIPAESFKDFPETCAFYAHFQNVRRSDHNPPSPNPPYPPEDAAVHHVFQGGWIWLLRFNNGITSAGAALKTSFSQEIGLHPGREEDAWTLLLSRFPSLQQLFAASERLTPFYQIPRLAFHRCSTVGPNWALLPSAAGFVDPLLSTGFALTLLGIIRFAEIFEEPGTQKNLRDYESLTLSDLGAAADLVSALYSKMGSPEEFNLLTLLYFAALSFTETAHRLGKPELASQFLLNNNPTFRSARQKFCSAARKGEKICRMEIGSAIEPFNIAGLTDWKRNNWYPADFRDLLHSAQKLQTTPGDILEMLKRCGLNP